MVSNFLASQKLWFHNIIHRKFSSTGDKNWEHSHSNRNHLDNASEMFRFCEDQAVCRRVNLLSYFGEKFESCVKSGSVKCDNCARGVCDLSVHFLFNHNDHFLSCRLIL